MKTLAKHGCGVAHWIAERHRNGMQDAHEQTEAMAHTSGAADALDDPIMMAWASIGAWFHDLRFRYHARGALFWIDVTRRLLDYGEGWHDQSQSPNQEGGHHG